MTVAEAPETKINISTEAKVKEIVEARLLDENTEMALAMLEEGVEHGLIAKITGFDIAKIAALS